MSPYEIALYNERESRRMAGESLLVGRDDMFDRILVWLRYHDELEEITNESFAQNVEKWGEQGA